MAVAWEWGFKMKLRFILLIILLIVSCAPFSRQVMQEVKKEIAISDVIRSPEKFKGESVIWGGVIVETISRAGETLVIVRQTELDFQKRPKDLDQSAGRFIILYRGFLDPTIYSRDREITVAGTISGKEERPVGEHRYTYPIINAREIHLWEKREIPRYYYDPWYPWYRDPFLYPWYPYPYYPYRW